MFYKYTAIHVPSNLEALGAALAIASLTVMYGYFFKLGSIILD